MALRNLYLELEDGHKDTRINAFISDVSYEKLMNNLFAIYTPHYVCRAAAYKYEPLIEDNPSEGIKTNVLNEPLGGCEQRQGLMVGFFIPFFQPCALWQ